MHMTKMGGNGICSHAFPASGNRNPDILISSLMPSPLGHIL